MARKPIKTPSVNAVARWINKALSAAGISTSLFKPGSVRAEATSKAKAAGVSIVEILQAGGWTRESTFIKPQGRVNMK